MTTQYLCVINKIKHPGSMFLIIIIKKLIDIFKAISYYLNSIVRYIVTPPDFVTAYDRRSFIT